MTGIEIQEKIKAFDPKSEVSVKDLTGSENHYEIQIVSDQFLGLSHLERHRTVMKVFEQEFQKKEIHALSLKLRTKKEV